MIYALLMCKNGDTAILEWPDQWPLEIRRPAKIRRDFHNYWDAPHEKPQHETQFFRAVKKDSEYKIVYYQEV